MVSPTNFVSVEYGYIEIEKKRGITVVKTESCPKIRMFLRQQNIS